MKINLDDGSYLDFSVDMNKKLNILFKLKKDETSTIFLTAKLNQTQLENLITFLVSNKIKVSDD